MARMIKKILVVRFRRVGDAVLTTALCASLKKSFPEAEIHYVLNASIATLYDDHPDVDQVISFNNRDNANIFRYIYRVWQVMRHHHYDVIIDVRSTFRTLFFALFGLSVPYRIGTKKSYNHILHNYRIDNRRDKTTDVISHLLMLLKPLEAEREIVYCPEFRLYISAEEKQAFRIYMEQAGIDFSRPIILAAVTARLAHKVWSKDRMQEVLRRIIEKYSAQVIFNYASDEESAAINMYRDMGSNPNIFIGIKANSLRELCALAANCDFFFGNEGGPRHLSQALGVPAFAIFPPGIPKAMWLPADGDRYQGISPDDLVPPERQQGMGYQDRFNIINVDDTWNLLDPMLKKYLR
jgi:heptosyltransferase-2